LAKNLFLVERTHHRTKGQGRFLASWLEFRLQKNEILKLYLDRAYMGGGNYGSTPPRITISTSQPATSRFGICHVGRLFKAPSKYAPHVNLPAARARANIVLDNLVEPGHDRGQVFVRGAIPQLRSTDATNVRPVIISMGL